MDLGEREPTVVVDDRVDVVLRGDVEGEELGLSAALVWACSRLFQATRLSMLNIIDEAECIRRERAAGEERTRADESPAAGLRQQL